jgi:hypothetical protein
MIPIFGHGLRRYTPQGLVNIRLFDDMNLYGLAADIETNLLYFGIFSKVMIIGNEQGEVLHKFSILHGFEYLFASSNIMVIITNNKWLILYKDGKQITRFTDYRLSSSSICLMHDKEIVVSVSEDQINIWRTV